MRALCKLKAEPGIWMSEVPIPAIGHHDVLIKIRKTALCGTDGHIYNWDQWAQATIPVPMVVGHEFMGEVAALGSEVVHLQVGDRVSGEGHMVCGHCRQCRAGKRHLCRNTQGLGVNRSGCFADYLSLPASNIFKLPAFISDDIAACLDPLGNAVHTALSFDLVGEDVLITGAGPIGIMAASIAQRVGARHVVMSEVNPYRLELARKMGIAHVVDAQSKSLANVMTELDIQEGFAVGLEMSGNGKALNDMLAAMNHGGHIAILGIPPQPVAIDWNQVIFKGLFIKGIYGREMFETWYKMSNLLQSGLDLLPMITHHFPVSEFEQAFAAMRSANSGKVILNWDS